ncbi:MAG: hypothetical protein F4X83_01155 [Chloroflexi bacterium]|nr:hypothetical protein [Chloroflexota bacterium]
MTELAIVKRYCSIEDIECEKLIPFKGLWTYFFAYPGTAKWRDFTSILTQELAKRGFYGERWEDSVTNDLLFSKVCEGIYSHDFLVAEVTDPNPNVMLEVGYALAVGRQPILLKNINQKGWSRTLLTTLESCLYETRDDVYAYISNLLATERRIPEDPDRRLPFLENMGIFEDLEIPGTVYHVKPKLSTDWISKVDRTLNKSYFKLSTMDPSDSISDEFYPQAREIQRSSLVVASLVSSKTRDWQQHNSNVALLIGFAIGLGKRVLVLQDKPLTPFLDLGTVARPIDTESHAEDVVKAWLEVQTRLSVSQKVDSQRRTQAIEEIDHIRKVYLGHPDALQDNRLFDYFVPTKEFNDAVEGRRSIFIGRRGSGKSANFQAVQEHLRDRQDILTVSIAPDDFELEKISEFLGQSYQLASQELVFRNVWHYILLSEILKTLAEKTDRLFQSPDDITQDNLRHYYDNNQDLFNLDFGTRVTAVLKNAALLQASASEGRSDVDEQAELKSLRDSAVARRLKDFAAQEGIVYYVVADDLDKNWRPTSQQSIDLLIGLIMEADRLQRFFDGHLKVVMFLKEDIYDVLVRFDDDLSKRNFLRMEWTKSNLKHLVAERLANAADQVNKNDDSTWSVVFPNNVDGLQASEYILTRALPRPRDVLDFCQKSIDEAQRNGHSTVTERDILDGERFFSEGVFWSISTEFRGLYPGLEEVLFEFAGAAERMAWGDFEQLSAKVIRQQQGTMM